MHITKVLHIERPRLGNGAAAMLSFIDARRKNVAKGLPKRAEVRDGLLPRRRISVFKKVQGNE